MRDPRFALYACTLLLSCGVLVAALERLWSWRAYKPPGLLSWEVLRDRRRHRNRVSRVLGPLLGFPGFLLVPGSQAVAACALLFLPFETAIRPLALVVALGGLLLEEFRFAPYALTGASRMRLVVCGALCLQQVAPHSLRGANVTLWFIALQSCLSYAVAGLSKLRGAAWRTGGALAEVFDMPLHRRPVLSAFLLRHPAVDRFLGWGIIVFEVGFSLALVAGEPTCWFIVGAGLLFHLATATLMGFNHFFWAWAATYPAVVYVSVSLQVFQ